MSNNLTITLSKDQIQLIAQTLRQALKVAEFDNEEQQEIEILSDMFGDATSLDNSNCYIHDFTL